jgi:hypothetical protein
VRASTCYADDSDAEEDGEEDAKKKKTAEEMTNEAIELFNRRVI